VPAAAAAAGEEAATLRAGASPAPAESYDGCAPLAAGSPLLDEAWMRIGEHHFEDDLGANGLPLAVAAYGNVVRDPRSPLRDHALYKRAWANYRMDRYREAAADFARVVERADAARAEASGAARDLRADAIEYMAVIFAEVDWDFDGVPDAVRPRERLADAALLPQDRPYTAEVAARAGDVLFDTASYEEAAAVYEMVLQRWPLAPHAPRLLQRIVQCHERNRAPEAANRARRRLAEHGPESAWARANSAAHAEAVDSAAEAARAALYDLAVYHHHRGRLLRDDGAARADASARERAAQEHRLAAAAYREALAAAPDAADADEVVLLLADALDGAGDRPGAAGAFGRVRDSRRVASSTRRDAAFGAVDALRREVAVRVAAGALAVRTTPPSPGGVLRAVAAEPLPALLVDLNEARDRFVELFPADDAAPAFEDESAEAVYLYGHWEDARRRFQAILDRPCALTGGWRSAAERLRAMATALGDEAEARRLDRLPADRGCGEAP
jgi:TolA-binding protein